jgi:hypothetical protein
MTDVSKELRRPLWQMLLMLPLFLIYWPASKFVEWMDSK